jgi:hypothetical protein
LPATGFILALLLCASAARAGEVPGLPTRWSRSRIASDISGKLDQGKVDAAYILLKKHLAATPEDADLCCQYVRCLLSSAAITDWSNPFWVTTSLIDGRERSFEEEAKYAARLAVEFDAGVKPYISAVILSCLHRQAKDQLSLGEGVVMNKPTFLHWEAVVYDAKGAQKWAMPFANLADAFAKIGKAQSAWLCGNIAGDCAGGTEGDTDFYAASAALTSAIAQGKSSQEIAELAVRQHLELFAAECAADIKRADSRTARLIGAMRQRKFDLESFVTAKLIREPEIAPAKAEDPFAP